MSGNPAPKFCKTNQHFVPRFWIKRFAAPDGRIFGRRRGEARAFQVAASEIMTGDWTYTLFDALWRPADVLEDALSTFESEAAKTMGVLDDMSAPLDLTLKDKLCEVIAVSGCRLPWVMRRGHRRMKDLVEAFSRIGNYENDRQFIDEMKERFGVEFSEDDYASLRSRPDGAIESTARAVNVIGPQNPVLPEQEALRGARPVAEILRMMAFTLLDAPAESLVLGDTPLPDSELALGFLLPLSHKLLLSARPQAAGSLIFDRRAVTADEIETNNRYQFDSLLDIVVGSDRSLLEDL